MVVAIGTGFTGRMALGQPALPWADTRTYIAQVRGLLEGESMVIDGAIVKMIPPDGYLPPRPISVPILVAANGPKGFAVAHELGDGVMSIFGSYPEFEWCALLAFGTVLDPGESPDSDRALRGRRSRAHRRVPRHVRGRPGAGGRRCPAGPSGAPRSSAIPSHTAPPRDCTKTTSSR